MRFTLVGLVTTSAAVLVLATSLVLGLRAPLPQPESGVNAGRAAPAPLPRARIRVEVLNGAGIPGLARDVTRELRDLGFDVVHYGNAGPLARDSTTVLDRAGDPEAAQAVAAALRLRRVEVAVDTSLYLEATVLLGRDWSEARGEGQSVP